MHKVIVFSKSNKFKEVDENCQSTETTTDVIVPIGQATPLKRDNFYPLPCRDRSVTTIFVDTGTSPGLVLSMIRAMTSTSTNVSNTY